MYQSFAINVLLIAAVVTTVCWTANPLAILGLLLLRDMPFLPPGMLCQQEEAAGPNIGFLADIGGGDEEEYEPE